MLKESEERLFRIVNLRNSLGSQDINKIELGEIVDSVVDTAISISNNNNPAITIASNLLKSPLVGEAITIIDSITSKDPISKSVSTSVDESEEFQFPIRTLKSISRDYVKLFEYSIIEMSDIGKVCSFIAMILNFAIVVFLVLAAQSDNLAWGYSLATFIAAAVTSIMGIERLQKNSVRIPDALNALLSYRDIENSIEFNMSNNSITEEYYNNISQKLIALRSSNVIISKSVISKFRTKNKSSLILKELN